MVNKIKIKNIDTSLLEIVNINNTGRMGFANFKYNDSSETLRIQFENCRSFGIKKFNFKCPFTQTLILENEETINKIKQIENIVQNEMKDHDELKGLEFKSSINSGNNNTALFSPKIRNFDKLNALHLKIYDEDKMPIKYSVDSIESLTKNREAKSLIDLSYIWFNKTNVGITFHLQETMLKNKKIKEDKCEILSDSD